MKFTSKFVFIPILIIFSSFAFVFSLNSCMSLDSFEEKLASIFDFEKLFGSDSANSDSADSESNNSSSDSENAGSNFENKKTPITSTSRPQSPKGKSAGTNTKISSFNYAIPKDFSKAYSFRTDSPEEIAKKIPSEIKSLKTTNPASYVQKCCEFINANSSDGFEKVKIAHDIVALNTKYDAKNFWANTIPAQDYENVLKTGLAVCEGYSNLLKKFLDTLGFQNVKVHGYARGIGVSLLDEKSTASNHAWNLVKIENEYYFIDSTWDSGYMSGKNSVQRYTTDWLFIKPEHFIYSHFPTKQNQQLLENPLSSSEFLSLADFRPKFFEIAENFSIKSSKSDFDSDYKSANGNLIKENSSNENPIDENSSGGNSARLSANKFIEKQTNVSDSVLAEYNLKDDCSLNFSVTQIATKQRKNNLSFTKTENRKTSTTIQFPTAGLYQIQVFYHTKNARQGWSCAEFFVNAENASSILYPQVYPNSFEAEILSPIEMPLKKGETYHFEIKCPEKKFAAIINGRNFVQMQKSENGNFALDFEIPANAKTLNVGASNSERGSYQTIATYSCK